MTTSIEDELRDVGLGDERLNDRSRKVLGDLFSDPQASINAANEDWKSTKGAYRLFKNDNVDAEEILAAHTRATKERFEAHDDILIVQDTTELDFTGHPAEDSGVLNVDYRFGWYDHTHLAMTPEHLCLGALAVELFDRDPATLGQSQEVKKLPIEARESFRWLKGYRIACQFAGEFPGKRIISVADRECDIYDIFLEQQSAEHAAEFVIRAKQPRRTLNRDPDAGQATYIKVRQEVLQQDVRMRRQLDLPQTPKRAARRAELEIRTKSVEVKPPYNAPAGTPAVQYNVVLVTEVGGPGDATDIEWELITTLPIETISDVLFILDVYVARWPIEIYFRTLKTGCKVEDMQLKTNERRKRALMFYKIVAWRVMYATMLGRECPDLSCDMMFSEMEWKPVWKIVTKTPLPKKPPKLGEFMLLVGRLGGHNNREGDSPPGAQAIWTGMRRMTDFALAWEACGSELEPEPKLVGN